MTRPSTRWLLAGSNVAQCHRRLPAVAVFEDAERNDELVELAKVVADDDRARVARHHRVIPAALDVRELGKRSSRRHSNEGGDSTAKAE